MNQNETWNALTDWKHTDVDWVRVDISKEDLRQFTQKSDVKGLCQAISFLLVIGVTGTLAYWAFAGQHWILLALALYIHGAFYVHFGDALHELSHNTVFASRNLNIFFTNFFGVLYWPWNPHFYRISHQGYHHRYTLHQGSDGEDTPNYFIITPGLVMDQFFHVFHIKAMLINFYRFFTLTPTSSFWRLRSNQFKLGTWEQFVLSKASPKDQKQVYRFGVYALVFHVVLAAVCIAFGLWLIPVLITLAPFYGPKFHSLMCAIHQHAACEANHPDFRISCGDAILDPLSSLLYWRMEYHIEHHMYAAIPCYNLKKFSRFVADQLPPKQHCLPHLLKLHKKCKEKYGNWQYWRDTYGRYKEF